MNEKGRGVHSRLLFGIDIGIGNGWYGCPSHNPKRQGRASGQGLGINALASCGCREWLAWAWLVALLHWCISPLTHITRA